MSSSVILIAHPVPRQYAGRWVAWTPDGRYPLAAGNTPEEARRAAERRGPQPDLLWSQDDGVAYEWVPPADQRFIGNVL